MSLEGEALLLGIWKNIEELEDTLTLEELELIVKALREKEHRMMKFYAAFKGVDLDEGNGQSNKERFEAIKVRAEAKMAGKQDGMLADEDNSSTFADFGMEVETD